MKIHYCSDTHFDHYVFETSNPKSRQRQIDIYFRDIICINNIPEDERYMFIIPGDLSNYNSVTFDVLIRLKELFKHVLITTGNHDRYLFSKTQKQKYNFQSQNRIDELKEFCSNNDIIFLDGNIVEIDGKKFAGLCMFWDKFYYNKLEKREASDTEVLNFYDNYMNDSKCILDGFEPYRIPTAYGGSYFKSSFNAIEFFKEEYKKLQNFQDYADIDVMVTHYVPTIPHGMKREYLEERGSTFYMFDGEKDIERIKPKIWLFGHMHNKYDFIHKDVRFLCNPIGYPGETLHKVDWFEL